MRRAVDVTASWAESGTQRLGALLQYALDHQERLLVALVALILLAPVVIIAGTWKYEQATGAHAVGAETERPWRYLMLCEQCGHRERLSESPHNAREKVAGLYECPKCGAFKVSRTRRGSLSLTPGGP
jgi:hypothetical protein